MTVFFGCNSPKNSEMTEKKETILHAGREAPLGYLTLELYADSTFSVTNAGLRTADVYNGTFRLHYDTLKLMYNDSLPRAVGQQLLIEQNNLKDLDIIYGGLGINHSKIDLDKLREGKPIDSLELKERELLQGKWQHSEDDKSVVSIRQNFWSDYYDGESPDDNDHYKIEWRRTLPKFADKTSNNSSFLILKNKIDTLNYEILGVTDSTLSLMHFPTGRIHLYRKKK